MKKYAIASMLALGTFATTANAALWIDFNSNQDGGGTPFLGDPADPTSATHNSAGYSSYHASHEVAAEFVTATYNTTFANTGAATVTLTPAWSNTTDNRVMQSIDRGAGNDNQYTNPGAYDINLVTDWIGIDTRTGGGGNGNFDGTTGTPTWLDITLGGLPAGVYSWTSIHHDTENVHVNFNVYVDGILDGSGFQNSSSTGGSPANPNLTPGPANTYDTSFTSTGADVTIRFEPLSGQIANAVHNQLFALNGFQLEQIPEPSAGLLGIFGLALIGMRRRR